ncbi:acyltransferase family protein [Nguyenibacter vanlangensis]|uniref:Acyltransferase n=1 Tax=Nguyenibacter vanlangensis TaxID=1216886 RepID=A0A7Y7IUL2_9PROT|nr:acyltransferase [Nguyenibacter vanlangensis]NVN10595.1 acyltransferase [Nguyenibacter vanlangensis]
MPRRLFHTLDGLRGLAAAAVVLCHTPLIFAASWSPVGGYLAVDLFFGLSGFVLADAYSARLDAGMALSGFMWKRVLRLWPLYALGLTISAAATALAIAMYHTPASKLAPFLPALFYIPWFGSGQLLYPLNYPSWSLFYELVVNLVMAATWRKLTNRVLIGIVGLSALGLVATAYFYHSLNAGFFWTQIPGALARVGFSFFLGILLWRVHPRTVSSRLSAWVPMVLLGIGLALHPSFVSRGVQDVIEVFFLMPAIIWMGAATQPTGKSLAIFKALGAASYPLYTVHVPMLALLGAFAVHALHISTASVTSLQCLLILGGLLGFAWLLSELDAAFRVQLDRALASLRQRPAGIAPPIESTP